MFFPFCYRKDSLHHRPILQDIWFRHVGMPLNSSSVASLNVCARREHRRKPYIRIFFFKPCVDNPVGRWVVRLEVYLRTCRSNVLCMFEHLWHDTFGIFVVCQNRFSPRVMAVALPCCSGQYGMAKLDEKRITLRKSEIKTGNLYKTLLNKRLCIRITAHKSIGKYKTV